MTNCIPVLLALFLQAMYGAVDLMVVGQFGQPADVPAVSTGSQVMHTVTWLTTGLSMGVTVLAQAVSVALSLVFTAHQGLPFVFSSRTSASIPGTPGASCAWALRWPSRMCW